MTFPVFFGVVSGSVQRGVQPLEPRASGWDCKWDISKPQFALWTRDLERAFNQDDLVPGREMDLRIFIWGKPLLASGSSFDTDTIVERVKPSQLPEKIASLYQRYGTHAFALLEGNFSIVIFDPASRTTLLVVDKFGCEDIYFQQSEESFAFASHPSLLVDSFTPLDPLAAAFFLAHEGFVPAPFTLFEGVASVGRAKFVRIKTSVGGISVESERYWAPSRITANESTMTPVDEFHGVLAGAVALRRQERNGILLSGGADSSLLANLLPRRRGYELLAMTGAVRGHAESELEMQRAAELSSALGIPHESIYLHPQDESLPDEWVKCTGSWSGGTRITLPLFYRLATKLRELVGDGCTAFSGQMADTLADNNYTLPSFGYTARRILFSSWFLEIARIARMPAPRNNTQAGVFLCRVANALAGPRLSEMVASVLDGLSNNVRFYEGRVFGFGEMPGRSAARFPVLTRNGFKMVADWYSSNFVAPVVSRLTPQTFYRDMIDVSMDMVMLHLDTRLVVHALRLGGASAELPFLDSCVVEFFAGMPYAARAFYRHPKYVIDAQFKKHGYLRPDHPHRDELASQSRPSTSTASSFEDVLLAGTLGAYFRELLRPQRILDQAPDLFEFMDARYYEQQMQAFRVDLPGVDCKFICRLAALELWAQARASAVSVLPVAQTA
jgi:hypothetical protein